MALIQLKNVTFSYPQAHTAAIRDVTLQVEKGQFVVLFGSSGSGKSTLLRLLKKEIQPHGNLNGEIFVNGQNIQEDAVESNRIGFVFQDPENQVVADDVLHEVVFGLENIGVSTNEMRSRVAEIVHFFGAESLLHRKTHELSGGMKQQINLASVLLMQPEILLLDEPTSQLDPVSSREFLDMLVRLNEEFGMTIIIAEHRLDEVFSVADHIVMMEEGKVKVAGDPCELMEQIWDSPHRLYVPIIPSLYLETTRHENRNAIPMSVKEGRKWIQNIKLESNKQKRKVEKSWEGNKLLEIKELFYQYHKEDGFIIKDLDFSLMKGELYALLGGNGSGKSTLLKILTGILKPSKGKIQLYGKSITAWKSNERSRIIAYLPQNPKLFFIHDTLDKEIQDTMRTWGVTDHHQVTALLERLGIVHLKNSHPYDLSGGELQKAALACVLIRKPEILLLDEPTKGLDPISKDNLSAIIKDLQKEGLTVIMATHDIEFSAQHATKCGMLFQGNMTSENSPQEFFKGNFFYTTMVQRVFRNSPCNEVVTLEEAVPLCRLSNE
jgi:energy-coupling factor transport system ATP-binding protein